MADVILARKLRLLDVAARLRHRGQGGYIFYAGGSLAGVGYCGRVARSV